MREIFPSRGLSLFLVACGLAWAAPSAAEEASRLDQVLDTIIANEREVADKLEEYGPLVETYLQTVRPDPTLGSVPIKDSYIISRLDLYQSEASVPEPQTRTRRPKRKNSLTRLDDFHSQAFKPGDFARMLIVDRGGFDRESYEFEFLRAEFLGEVRTLVFDVTPRPDEGENQTSAGQFTGRIWVEDLEFNIVRFNGIYSSTVTTGLHFDSWRLNMAPGVWLPAYVYTEDSKRALKHTKLTHKGQTRIWGYELGSRSVEDEFTKVLIDAPETSDRSEAPGQVSPIESARAWESEAEDNVIRRLERSGLLAPEGEVDQVLETVVANLEITNNLDIHPPVRCRVLLTTPLESFTVGHTIVLSRGLIDVLPDEASLAMVLAHELGHVLSAHELDTSYAFSDRVLVGDRQALQQFVFDRDPAEELEADARAEALLHKSPYRGSLDNAGLFLKAIAERADDLPALIRPHFGSRMAKDDPLHRMARVAGAAPELKPASLEQTAALPLGGRVKLDPWNATIELMKNNRVELLSAREKMEFQVTPLMPYLARYESNGEAKASPKAPGPGSKTHHDDAGETVAVDRSRR